KSSPKKWLFIGLGVAATGALSYFGWQYWKKHKSQSEEDTSSDAPDFSPVSTPSYTPPKPKSNPTPSRNDSFPLKNGSKGGKAKAGHPVSFLQHGIKIRWK